MAPCRTLAFTLAACSASVLAFPIAGSVSAPGRVLAVSLNEQLIYAGSYNSGNVSIVSVNSSIVLATASLAPQLMSMVVDPVSNAYVLVGQGKFTASPPVVYKIHAKTLELLDTLALATAPASPWAAVTDGKYAYWGIFSQPAVISRILLSNFTEDSALTLLPEEGPIHGMVIDGGKKFMYCALSNMPTIVRVSTSPFARDSAVTIGPADAMARTMVLHPYLPFMYALSVDAAGTPLLQTVLLAASGMKPVGTQLSLPADAFNVAVISPSGRYLYLSGYTSPACITEVDTLSFNVTGHTCTSGDLCEAAVITHGRNGSHALAWFGTTDSDELFIVQARN